MATPEMLTDAALVNEQMRVQATKTRFRSLELYNEHVFTGVGQTVMRLIGRTAPGANSINALLDGFAEQRGADTHWADMGGGFGIAMRQAARLRREDAKQRINMTLVDLFDWEKQTEVLPITRDIEESDYEPVHRPFVLEGDVDRVQLEEPADLITSIHVMQYLNDPLASISNWYNQLNDNGLMVISGEDHWSTTIGDTATRHGEPFQGIFEHFVENGISFATDVRIPTNDRGRFTKLAVRKKSGTILVPCVTPEPPVIDPTTDYKRITYPIAETPIEVVHT